METLLHTLKIHLETTLYGKPDVIEHTMVAALAGGHLLVEDLPGVGKTTLGRAAAILLGGDFQRVQFTADLMPSDLTGVNIFHPREGNFIFQPGPIFCHVLLADEINRASPKVQSSLLEAMGEGQVSIDRKTHILPKPFWVIATQNPLDFEGTYPLPESQLDRFMLSTSVGYPDTQVEQEILRDGGGHKTLESMKAIFTPDSWHAEQMKVNQVRVDESIIQYLLAIVQRTRSHELINVGVSTRGALSWLHACKARAIIKGRAYVTPHDVKSLAVPALAHRLSSKSRVGHRSERISLIETILKHTPVPR